jgi:peptide chain release factor 3
LFARDRDTVEEAYPGDILGLINPGAFAIGDSVSSGGQVQFGGIPRFAPEHFGQLRCPDPSNHKKFRNGLDQLKAEGAVQLFYASGAGSTREPILAVVGRLQFDVIQFRLKAEYNVDTIFEPMNMKFARWVVGSDDDIAKMSLSIGTRLVEDSEGRPAVLFDGEWGLSRVAEKNPNLKFENVAPS